VSQGERATFSNREEVAVGLRLTLRGIEWRAARRLNVGQ